MIGAIPSLAGESPQQGVASFKKASFWEISPYFPCLSSSSAGQTLDLPLSCLPSNDPFHPAGSVSLPLSRNILITSVGKVVAPARHCLRPAWRLFMAHALLFANRVPGRGLAPPGSEGGHGSRRQIPQRDLTGRPPGNGRGKEYSTSWPRKRVLRREAGRKRGKRRRREVRLL